MKKLLWVLIFILLVGIAKPRLEWLYCNCNDMTLGLNDQDYMLLVGYIKTLEHKIKHQCEPEY